MTWETDAASAVADDTGGVGLPARPGRIGTFWAQHPRLTTAALVLLWGAAGVGGVVATARPSAGTSTLVAVGLVLVAVAGIPFRSDRPWVTVVASIAVLVAMSWAAGAFPPLLYAVYTASVSWSARVGWVVAAVAEVAAAGAAFVRIGLVEDGAGGVRDVLSLQLVALLLVAVLVGVNVGGRRRYLESVIDRAQQLARERDQQAQLATAAERARIAREMHDIVSHSVTVMVRLAEGAAAGIGDEHSPAVDAMRGVARVGRGAMTDMRRMLGVLGGGDHAELMPSPTMRDLPRLVDDFQSLGSPVTLEIDGVLPDDPSLQLAVYRIVQEGLTNATRYAAAARHIHAAVRSSASSVEVSVVDDGTGGVEAGIGAGRGIVGITERVATLGGHFHAGERAERSGWEIRASIPIRTETR